MIATEYMFFLACLIVICYFGTKTFEYLSLKKRYRSEKDEFMSDLYRIQIKWAKKGCVEYSRSLSLIIDAFNLPADEEQPSTDEGKEILRKLSIIKEEEKEEDEL